MIQLNLLPDLKKEFINAQKSKSLVISVSIVITMAAVGLSALLFVYVTFLQQVQISLATDDINKKTQDLKAIQDVDKYLTIQNQLSSLPDLHAEKGSYSRLFDFLGVLNPSAPNNVTLNNLQVLQLDKSVVFSGVTANFETLNVFVDTLKNAQVSYKVDGEGEEITEKMFDQVLVQSSDLARVNNNVVVAFVVRTVYRDPVFDTRNKNMTARVPNITTTQSVTQSPQGQQLFNDQGGQ